jgi:hypothetical protein
VNPKVSAVVNPHFRLRSYDDSGETTICLWAPVRHQALQSQRFTRRGDPRSFAILSKLLNEPIGDSVSTAEEALLRRLKVLLEPTEVSSLPKFVVPAISHSEFQELTCVSDQWPALNTNPLDWRRFCRAISRTDTLRWAHDGRSGVVNPWHVIRADDADSSAPYRHEVVDGEPFEAAIRHANGRFRACGFATLPTTLGTRQLLSLSQYYSCLVDQGWLHLGDAQSHRFWSHNDAISRVLQARYRPLIQQIVGRAIRPSYTYLIHYLPGATLPRHIDREQCQYTVSMLIDCDSDLSGRSRWPLILHPDGQPDFRIQQYPGDIAIYRGPLIPHSRPTMSEGSFSTSVLLHYVDASTEHSLE